MSSVRKRKKSTASVSVILICIVAAFVAGCVIGMIKFDKFINSVPLDGNVPLVETAADELGTEYGEKYWSWYGFDSHVDWCACFVSWCVNENADEYKNDMEPFCYVPSGVAWFECNDQWRKAGETPEAGDIIFFDWDCSGEADHVGIVSGCAGDYVFTIEGNSRDQCRRKGYPLDSKSILGYGVLE